jgi:hypothetical protein
MTRRRTGANHRPLGQVAGLIEDLRMREQGDPGRSRRMTPACNGPISVRDADAARTDADNLSARPRCSEWLRARRAYLYSLQFDRRCEHDETAPHFHAGPFGIPDQF